MKPRSPNLVNHYSEELIQGFPYWNVTQSPSPVILPEGHRDGVSEAKNLLGSG
jgi:mannosyltransferase OCH1-like enzyme